MTKIEQYVIDKVRSERIKNNFSQVDLANYLNVSPGFISSIESPKGKAKYNLNHINCLAKLFNCSPREFLPQKYIEDGK
ncbi:MAG: helix-turn-helix transcriptional regulator [Bacteroidales bacterium]|nr:helix-turn-helix transcriptional regulator [Bacteroidales bacterium]